MPAPHHSVFYRPDALPAAKPTVSKHSTMHKLGFDLKAGPGVLVTVHGHENANIISVLKGNGSPYLTAKRRVPELIPVLGSQPAGDVSHNRSGRLP